MPKNVEIDKCFLSPFPLLISIFFVSKIIKKKFNFRGEDHYGIEKQKSSLCLTKRVHYYLRPLWKGILH